MAGESFSHDYAKIADWPLEDIIDYSNDGKYNNIKMQISGIDTKLLTYLDNVDRVIENERSYGLSKDVFQLDGVNLAETTATDIHDDVVELKKKWKNIKKKYKKTALEKRLEILNEMYLACSAKLSLSAGWLEESAYNDNDKKYNDKRKKIDTMRKETERRLNKM